MKKVLITLSLVVMGAMLLPSCGKKTNCVCTGSGVDDEIFDMSGYPAGTRKVTCETMSMSGVYTCELKK